MNDLTISLEPDAGRSDLERIVEGVFEANAGHVRDERRELLPITVRAPDGTLRGGAITRMVFGDLYIDNIWIEPEWRREGLGRRILAEAEHAGRSRGGRWSFANTLLPGSRRFFQAAGYSVFAEVEDLPPGQRVTFLRKSLAG